MNFIHYKGFISPTFLCVIIAVSAFITAEKPAHAQACGTSSGSFVATISCTPASGDAIITTTSGTTVTTSGSIGILATAQNSNASISLTGTTVNTSGLFSGIRTNIGSGSGNSSITFAGGTNTIVLAASADTAALATGLGTGTASIMVNAGAVLNITNNAVGNERDGLEVTTAGSGAISIRHNGTGTISTRGGNGIFLKAGTGNATAEVGSGVTLIVDNTDSSSQSTIHAGIIANISSSNAFITNGAAIQASGSNGRGIYVLSSGVGNIDITNTGNIVTSGTNGASAIRAAGSGTGNSTITVNNATIRTNGTGALNHGVEATARGGTATITFSNGSVNVAGQSAGIAAYNSSSGQPSRAVVTIVNSTIDATRTFNQGTVQSYALTSATMDIDATTQVHGGWENTALPG